MIMHQGTRRSIMAVRFVLIGMAVALVVPSAAHGADRHHEADSLLGKALTSPPPGDDLAKLEADLAAARKEFEADPDNPEKIVWVGRRLGYLWRINEAIEVYTTGIAKHPDYAPLYRHRGHRYITARKFDLAIADLEKAAQLMEGKVDQVEEDGQPSSTHVPLTTLDYNIYYHLGLARYFKGDYIGAILALKEGRKYVRVFDDNRIALTYWIYNALCLTGRQGVARSELIDVDAGMNVIENKAYYRLLRMYLGSIKPEEVIPDDARGVDRATLMYGLGVWYLYNNDADKARSIFRKIVADEYWPAFGHIAAEVHLARDKAKE